jgi:two-component system alkaline phosphatase synthesis response regulator PhoP
MDEILIVEDDQDIADLLALALKKEGWSSRHAADAEAALAALRQRNFSACILDLMLPGMDGLSFLKVVRSMRILDAMPVIIASAKDDDSDIVSGLELGADDYVPKPFSTTVLSARMRAVFRRTKSRTGQNGQDGGDTILERHGITLNRMRHETKAGGASIDLSATEFAILELFLKEPGRVFTREQIIDFVKGPDYPVTDRAIDVHILSIRRKLGESGILVETVRGIGYRLRDEV